MNEWMDNRCYTQMRTRRGGDRVWKGRQKEKMGQFTCVYSFHTYVCVRVKERECTKKHSIDSKSIDLRVGT